MSQAVELRERLRSAIQSRDITVAEIARLSGVHKATIHRLVSDDYEFTPSTRTMEKLAEALLQVYHFPTVDEDLLVTRPLVILPVRRDIGRGSLHYPEDSRFNLNDAGPFYRAPTIDATQWAARVRGRSAEPEYRDGDIVHVVELEGPSIYLGAPTGEHLLVEWVSPQDGASEMRIFSFVGRARAAHDVELVAVGDPSSAPQHLTLPRGETVELGGYQVRLAGQIVASYRSRSYLTAI
jgi:transcriptional regulator with XRE-family HTH domain